jgi:uncharacterized protein YukE
MDGRMDGQLRVELADLRGYADQVGRAGEACASLADYVATFVPDGDFGRILSLITPDYEHLVLRVGETLDADSARLAGTRAGLRHVAKHYARTDAGVAQRFGAGFGTGAAAADDETAGPAFRDVETTAPPGPECGGQVLPEVTFGWVADQVCALVRDLGGPDLRREITDWVAGDVGKASTQASVWEHAAVSVAAVRRNLVQGAVAVATTWEGLAAEAARGHVDAWAGALDEQSDGLTRLAAHLRDVIEQAIDVAQLVVDVVKEIISIVLAGLTLASVPIFGQVQLVDKVRDAVRLANDARKVLTVFWNFLLVVKDSFVLAVDCFTAEALPPAPVSLVGAR